MGTMSEKQAKRNGFLVVAAAFLALFCLFGYRSTFSILQGPMRESTGWTTAQTSLGYSLMMTVYAITAFFSGMIADKWGTRPAYLIGAVFAALGFYLTSLVSNYYVYLAVYSIFAGIGTGMLWVSTAVSIRKWYVGKMYGTMSGIAFAGSPIAQVLLSLGLKSILASADWRVAMRYLAVVVFAALIIAALLARKTPDAYGVKPFGLTASAKATENRNWTIKEAFSTFAIWGAILALLTSMVAEFLIWSQIVSYWVTDHGWDLSLATNLYIVIGISGIFTMPIMGKVSDKLVERMPDEVSARKAMLIFAPAVGAVACILLMGSGISKALAAISCVLFAIYWAIEPGGVAGYVGAVYGSNAMGRIWGLGTLIVMSIGPALGSFMGGFLYDLSGSYTNSIYFALGSYLASTIFGLLLPKAVRTEQVAAKPKTETA